MIVGDDYFGTVHLVHQIGRHQFAAGIVTIRIIWLENTKAILDSQAGCNDQKTTGKFFAIGSFLVFLGLYLSEGRIQWHPFHKLKSGKI